MSKTTFVQRLSRDAVCLAMALAVNAGAAWGFSSLDTKGEKRLAADAAVAGVPSTVVYLGELPGITVYGQRA